IIGAATTLLGSQGRLQGNEHGELVGAICDEARRMDRLIANILDMARVSSGGLALAQDWVPLEEVVGAALEHLDAKLAGREVRLDLPADLPFAWIDSVLFEHLLVNLVENAVDHAGGAGPIEISARVAGESLEVRVADHGAGLPVANREALFERFTRGPRARGGGVGLGLAICRAVARAHGGDVVAEDRPGGGALFRVVVPLSRDEAAEAPAGQADQGEWAGGGCG
ncbi:MAG: ATP-binding protein, partial [Candidatus Bipolaricaulota bacterium]